LDVDPAHWRKTTKSNWRFSIEKNNGNDAFPFFVSMKNSGKSAGDFC
jgi:hypothetical protein